MPHAATQVANLLRPVRGCPLRSGGTEQGLCSPAVGPGLGRSGTDRDFAVVSLFPSKSSIRPQKFRLVTRGRAGQLILADAKTNKQIKFWKFPTGSFRHFSEGNIEFWKAWFMRRLSGFHNAEKKGMVAHLSPANHSYVWVSTALVWVGN